MAEDFLNNVKRGIELGAHTGLELLEPLAQPSGFRVGQSSALARAQRNVPLHCEALILSLFLNTLKARINERCQLIAVQQRRDLGSPQIPMG